MIIELAFLAVLALICMGFIGTGLYMLFFSREAIQDRRSAKWRNDILKSRGMWSRR